MLRSRVPYSEDMRALRGILALALLLATASLPAAPPPPGLDTLLVQLDLEKRGRLADVEELDRLNARIVRAEGTAAAARARLVQTLRDGEANPDAIDAAEDGIAEAEARADAAELRRRVLVARISERARRIAALSDDIARRRSGPRGAADPVSGRWNIVINPGAQRGVYRLALDGTLVSGTYVLEGNFHGSLRGTYIGDKLTLQRVDSERGIDATFYGRVVPAQRRVSGTWEATVIAPATGPTSGTWGGTLTETGDESEGERP